MGITPVNDHVMLRPLLHSDIRAKEIMARSGLYLAKPDNKMTSFEGIPSQGIVYALPEGYTGELKIGARVVFSETAPKGFKHEGVVLFPIAIDKIIAEVVDDTEKSS